MRLIFLAGVLLLNSAVTWADNYKIDPAHTSVVFKISHLGFSHVYGMFSGASGQFTIDETKPEKSMVEINVPTDSVTTLMPKRDEHLRSPDFFNVKQFGTISFKSKSVKKIDASHYAIMGDLTLHGVTKPLNFTFSRLGTGKDPMGKIHTGGDVEFKIKRSDFGMNFMNEPGKVGDEVELMISLEGTKV